MLLNYVGSGVQRLQSSLYGGGDDKKFIYLWEISKIKEF